MTFAAQLAIFFVSIIHFYFLILEMFLWTKPFGRKVFRLNIEQAETQKALAANQGLYNGFLSAGLLWSVVHPDPNIAEQIAQFFLVCVIIAGIYGALTVSRKIFYIQSAPALIAFLFIFL